MGHYNFKLPDVGEGIAESEIATWRAMLDLLSGYDYQVEPAPQREARVTEEEIHQAMRNSMGANRFWSGFGA